MGRAKQYFILFFLIELLHSCGSKVEKWICTDKEFSENSIIINGNSIKTHLKTINSDGNEYYDESSFTIEETIYHENDKNQRLYILFNTKKKSYSVLPELIIDPETRKCLPYEAVNATLTSKKELKGYLYKKTSVRNRLHPEDGPISAPMYYGYFGYLKTKGANFKLK